MADRLVDACYPHYYLAMKNGQCLSRLALILVVFAAPIHLRAQTDEIQVYTGELETPGKMNLTIHSNYTPDGRTVAGFPGGIVPQGSVNGAFEWAYGVTDWFEAGTYLPVYTFTRDRKLELDGAKLRALFAVPHAETRRFFYGVNFELSFNAKHWEQSRHSGEIRPIIGGRSGPWDFIVNPIVDTSFDGFSHLDFAPSLRLAYNRSPTFALAAEHYADFGQLHHFEPAASQEHNVFGVADFSRPLFDLEAGIGFGLTKASDKLVFKTILSHTF
ncbi:MAG: hypothetical protein ACXU9Z_02330 [Gemmatimonadaceae bacterium]